MTNIVKINFCFPKSTSTTKTKKAFVNALISGVSLDKKMGYAGYSYKKYLRETLLYRFNSNNIKDYRLLSIINKKRIEKVVRSTVQKCFKKLPPTATPISIFIFPWFPKKNDGAFGGINGFAPYANTFHLFISLNKFSVRSLRETTAHELNHAVFFGNYPSEQTLLASMIIEGLAENFREEVVGGISAPWSTALTVEESIEMFTLLKPSLDKYNLYQEVFWNGEKYKRWTGYSIGYRIIKSFRKTNPMLTWEEIMKMKPQEIFDKSNFIK